MAKTPMIAQAKALKEIVLDFLQGQTISVVRVRLQNECVDSKTGCKELYQGVTLEESVEALYIPAILNSLNIKKSTSRKQGPYEDLLNKSANLYELLIHLYYSGHHQVGYLIDLIESTKPKYNWPLLFTVATAISAGISAIFLTKQNYLNAFAEWIERAFPTAMNWIGRTFSLLRNIPLLGIIAHSISLLRNWYTTFAYGTSNTPSKWTDVAFKTVTAALKIGSYALLFASAGVMSIAAASLAVLGSGIDVIKSMFTFFNSQHTMAHFKAPNKEDNWETRAEYERVKNMHQYAKRSFGIKLTAAILVTAAMAVWCFFPPSFVLTICCMSLIAFVSLAKWSSLTTIHEENAKKLQRSLKNIDTALRPELNLSQQNLLTHLLDRQKGLDAKEKELLVRENAISQREETLQATLDEIEAKHDSSASTTQTRGVEISNPRPVVSAAKGFFNTAKLFSSTAPSSGSDSTPPAANNTI